MKLINEMIDHYTPLFTSLKTMAGYKTSSLMGASVFSAISMEAIIEIFQLNFLGVSLVDWWTGSVASHKRAKEAKAKADAENNTDPLSPDLVTYEDSRIKSRKISYTIFKFISIYLWLVLSHSIYQTAIKNGFIIPSAEPVSFGLSTILRILTIVPILLFGFREYISVGENIKSIYGKTPYLFTLGEKIFNIFEFNFLKKIDKATSSDSDIKKDDNKVDDKPTDTLEK
jgi:hypothetical protein